MPPIFLEKGARDQYEALLVKYNTWLFDCDGVLWNGDKPVEGAKEVLEMLRRQNKSVIFVTNNATKSRKNYKKKFDKLGIDATVDEIFGSAYAAAVYISSVMQLPKDKKVYVIGMSGIEEELKEEGVAYIGGTTISWEMNATQDPADNTLEPFSLADFALDPSVSVVLCGLDTSINYTKLSKAFQYLTRNEGCAFLATNIDSTFPDSSGLLPGAGSLSAPLRFALGRDPLSTGKPSKTMLDCVRAKHDFDPTRTIMVGDRLNTDILFGQEGGISTLLVLTGITKLAEITGANASDIVPEYVSASLGDLAVAGG